MISVKAVSGHFEVHLVPILSVRLPSFLPRVVFWVKDFSKTQNYILEMSEIKSSTRKAIKSPFFTKNLGGIFCGMNQRFESADHTTGTFYDAQFD